MKTKTLSKISTYARKKKISVQHVYWLGNKGRIKIVKIDSIKFVEE